MSRAAKIGAALGAVVLLLVIAVVVFLPGEEAQPQDPARRPPAGVDRAALQEFRDCLADHGIDLPNGAPAGGGPPSGFDPSDPNLRAAFSACRDELPQGAAPPGRQAPF